MDNNMDQPGAAEESAGEFGTQTDEADRDAKEQIARLRAQKINSDPKVQQAIAREKEIEQRLRDAEKPIIRLGIRIGKAESAVLRAQRLHDEKHTPSTLDALQQAQSELDGAKTAKADALKAMKEAEEEFRKATAEREAAESEALSSLALNRGMRIIETAEKLKR